MNTVQLSGHATVWTVHGKRKIALAMIHRAESFLGAAVLLKKNRGNGYVWRHLACQSAELLMKGALLLHDYNRFRPRLRKLGHRLTALADICIAEFGLRPMSERLRSQLTRASELFAHHDLRYASGLDILVDPETIDIDLVLRRVFAASLLVRRAVVGRDHASAN